MNSQAIFSVSRKVLLIALLLFLNSCSTETKHAQCELVKVIDGDSMVLNKILEDGTKDRIEVRLLGVDAPEFTQENWGPKARDFVITQLGNADTLEIEYDQTKKDKYGRSLIYLYYVISDKQLESQKTKLLNEELLRNGFAEIYSDKDNSKYLRLFKNAEAQARFSKLNIWQEINGLAMSPKNYRKLTRKHKKETAKAKAALK